MGHPKVGFNGTATAIAGDHGESHRVISIDWCCVILASCTLSVWETGFDNGGDVGA